MKNLLELYDFKDILRILSDESGGYWIQDTLIINITITKNIFIGRKKLYRLRPTYNIIEKAFNGGNKI